MELEQDSQSLETATIESTTAVLKDEKETEAMLELMADTDSDSIKKRQAIYLYERFRKHYETISFSMRNSLFEEEKLLGKVCTHYRDMRLQTHKRLL